MKRVLVPVACGVVLAVLALVSPVKGQTPPPPPSTAGLPGPPPPPCPPSGCPTATPTVTPIPTDTPTPTSTPTATPTNTPIPLFIQVKLAHKSVKAGAKQKVSVKTVPAAHVTVQVAFPNKSKKHHGGHAGSGGKYSWSFKQPAHVTSGSNKTAKVTVTVSNGVDSKKSTKKYTLS